MIHTRSMAINLRQVQGRVRRINRRHHRIMNPAYRFRQGPAPWHDFIQLEINNVEANEIKYVHFVADFPIPRYIDLTED